MPYKDPEKRRENDRKNRVRYATQKREDRAKNPEKYKEWDKARYVRDREKRLASSRSWAFKNPEKKKANDANRDKTKKKEYQDVYTYKNRFTKYGIDLALGEALLAKQKGRCALCRLPFGEDNMSYPVLDHDHLTGRYRAFIHRRCNSVIGFACDNTYLLQKAVEYLDEHLANPSDIMTKKTWEAENGFVF